MNIYKSKKLVKYSNYSAFLKNSIVMIFLLDLNLRSWVSTAMALAIYN